MANITLLIQFIKRVQQCNTGMFILLSLSYFHDIIGFQKVDVMLKLQVGAVGCLKVLVIVRMECTTVVAL